eukprot:8937098-Pyramimonas_sp.AAC.1
MLRRLSEKLAQDKELLAYQANQLADQVIVADPPELAAHSGGRDHHEVARADHRPPRLAYQGGAH